MFKYIVLVSLLLLAVSAKRPGAPPPPNISEVFYTGTAITISFFNFNFTGTGTWAANQPVGESVEQADFGKNHPLNEYRLARYDLHREYDMFDMTDCRSFPLEGPMPVLWGWISNPSTKYSRMEFMGKMYDAWTLAIGYASITIGVIGNTPVFFISQSEVRNTTIQFLSWTTTITNTSIFNVPSNCNNKFIGTLHPLNPENVGCEERKTMMSRAEVWVAKHVPYNQGATYEGYREDCSGYVSMAWETSKPGYTTFTLPEISHPISKSELQEGDVLLCTTEHVVLFGGWTDSDKSHYMAYEETTPGTGTIKSVAPYPYWYNTGCFKPYRYDKVC